MAVRELVPESGLWHDVGGRSFAYNSPSYGRGHPESAKELCWVESGRLFGLFSERKDTSVIIDTNVNLSRCLFGAWRETRLPI